MNYRSRQQHPEPQWVEALMASLLRDQSSLKLSIIILRFFQQTVFKTYRDMIHYSSPILLALSGGPRQQS